MNVDKIEKLDEVLLHLGPNQKIKDYNITRLTAPGENYGSLMLRLQVKLIDEKTKEEEDLDLVAKLLPPNEMLRKIFNIQVTFRNEASLYSVIVPVLEEFQRQQGVKELVDVFAKFYGARYNLDPTSDVIDDGAVLLLENLRTAGFTTGDRMVGFDLPSARLLVRNLAYFHAVPLALKLKDPDLFEKKIKPFLVDFDFGDEGAAKLTEDVTNILKQNHECLPYLEKVKEQLKQKLLKTVHEPFATISHNDYWVNNMLLKFENGKPAANKMVDFQVIEYKSPCRDLVFFLFSSVQLPVLKERLDELIDLYYKSFIEKLEELRCDISPFSRKAFDKQLELAAKENEYFHLVGMVFPICRDPAGVKELSELSEEDFNVKTEPSFTTAERPVGFDLPSARLLVRNLAYFHAVPLALKLKNPDLFEEKIKPFLADYHITDEVLDQMLEDVRDILKENDTCIPYIGRVEELIKQKSLKTAHEPFATILHNDYWVNNMLLKFENGKAVANRMVDFQVIEYKCPCRDLIFFLFSSVQLPVLKEYLDELIDLYYKSFIEKLEELKCDTAPFSRKAFDKQLELAAKEAEYFHLVAMVFPICADSADVKELSELSTDDFKVKKEPSAIIKNRIMYITLEFIKRGWL